MKVLIESNTRRIAFYSTKVARIKLEFPFTVNIAKADDARRREGIRIFVACRMVIYGHFFFFTFFTLRSRAKQLVASFSIEILERTVCGRKLRN